MTGPLDAGAKGWPAAGASPQAIAAGELNLLRGDLPLPVLALKRSALEHNLALMARWCAEHGVALAPHAKTSMAPALVRRQLEAGAWGITVATAQQAWALSDTGVERILIANELVDPGSIATVAALREQRPELRLLALVDSVAGVELLAAALGERASRVPTLDVLVEVGCAGGRAGCRSDEEVRAVAAAVAAATPLRLVGVELYEAVAGDDRAAAAAQLDRARALLIELEAAGAFAAGELIVSAGGSVLFDLVAERLGGPWPTAAPVRTVVRSGCYLTHDSGFYAARSPLDGAAAPGQERLLPALELWGAVLSRPEPGLAVVGFGKRDAAYDLALPTPERIRRRGDDGRPLLQTLEPGALIVTALNDQHALVAVGEQELAVGDWIGCGISHPCTAFDKWRVVPVVEDDGTVVEAVETRF